MRKTLLIALMTGSLALGAVSTYAGGHSGMVMPGAEQEDGMVYGDKTNKAIESVSKNKEVKAPSRGTEDEKIGKMPYCKSGKSNYGDCR